MTSTNRLYARICALEDFSDPEFARMARELAPSLASSPPHRKLWEWVMGALFLRDHTILRPDASVLDVGAGTEPILFWLANRVGRVVALDIYGEGEFSRNEAAAEFQRTPERWAPYAYPRERLIVSKQDARSLEYEDASFDAVISFSSIEHFGGREAVRTAAGEIGRVLKPGGVAFIVTELLLRVGAIDRVPLLRLKQALTRRVSGCRDVRERLRPSGDIFTLRELHDCIVAPSGLRLIQPLTLEPLAVEAAKRSAVQMRAAVAGAVPHLALIVHGSVFTSVGLPLRKPDSP